MGFLDTVQIPGASKAAAAPVASAAPKGAGNFLSTVQLPTDPTESAKIQTDTQAADQAKVASDQANSFGGIVKGAIGSAFSTVANFGKSLVAQYTNPDQYTQNLENSVTAPGSTPGSTASNVLKDISIPAIRTFAPITESLNTDIASGIILNQPELYKDFIGAVQDQNKSPEEAGAQDSIIGASQKSAPQVVGDTAQAVLGAYAPDVFGEDIAAFGEQGAKQAVAATVAHGAQFGFTYGLAQAASSGSTDPETIAGIVLKSTVGGAILNLATAAVAHGVAATIPEALAKIREKTPSLPAEDLVTSTPEETASAENTPTKETAPVEPGKEVAPAETPAPAAEVKSSMDSSIASVEPAPAAEVKLPADTTPAENASTETPAKEVNAKETPAQPIDSGGPKTVSGLAKSVKSEAISAGLEKSIGHLPEFSTMDMGKQAELAKDLIAKNPEEAMKVAKGEIPSPNKELLAESVFTAFRVFARETDDVEMSTNITRELAGHSETAMLARLHGQQIKALDSGASDDPLAVIKDVKETREAAVEKKSPGAIKKAKKEIADEISKEIKKTASKRQTWEDFVKTLEC